MAVNYWLLKTEPGDYSYDDLEKSGGDIWDGVKNRLALKHIRNIKPGDAAFIYHTGRERAVVGVADITSAPYTDPLGAGGGSLVFRLIARYHLPRPVTLAEIKADPFFSDWELVRLSRLSVMPVSRLYWDRIHHMSGMDGK